MSIYLVLIPFVFSLLAFIVRGSAKMIALTGALILLLFTGYLVSVMDFDGSAQFVSSWNWSASPPITLSWGLDGLNVLLVLLLSILLPLIILYSFGKTHLIFCGDQSRVTALKLTTLCESAAFFRLGHAHGCCYEWSFHCHGWTFILCLLGDGINSDLFYLCDMG